MIRILVSIALLRDPSIKARRLEWNYMNGAFSRAPYLPLPPVRLAVQVILDDQLMLFLGS